MNNPIFEALLIASALSVDAMVSGFAYGANGIKIPFSSNTIINIFCSACLAISLLFGRVISSFLPATFTSIICFAILFLLGLIKIFDWLIKRVIRKHKHLKKNVSFSAFNLGFILTIYANPENADDDHSKVLCGKEALCLAIALSLDSMVAGIGAGISNFSIVWAIIFSLFTDMIAVWLGCFLGRKMSKKLSIDLSWVSGVLLIGLALLKL